jgi:Family of unknown function (DUF6118)
MATSAGAEQTQGGTDPATLAFDALREEVALVRRAVAGLAAERGTTEIPDYSETLSKILRESAATANSLKTVAAAPALQRTAQSLAREIAEAGHEARRSDQEALTEARDAFRQAAYDITAKLTSAKAAADQCQWLLWTGIFAFFAGMLVLAIGIGPVVRAVPQSWHWPENIAASIVGTDQEVAGTRLIKSAAPERWRDIVFGLGIVRDNRDALAQCKTRATNKSASVRCAIEIKTAAFR